MAARSSPGGFVVATVTNPGSFMATITHPTGNGYCRDRILRDSPTNIAKEFPSTIILWLRQRANGDSFKPSEASTTSNSLRKSKFLLDKGNNENKIDCLKYGHTLFPLFHCKCSLTAIWPLAHIPS